MKTFSKLKEGNLTKLKAMKKPKTQSVNSFDRLGKGDRVTIGNMTLTLKQRVELKTHPYETEGWYIALTDNNYYITKSKNSDTYRLYKALKQSQVGSEYEPISKSPKLTKTKIIIGDQV